MHRDPGFCVHHLLQALLDPLIHGEAPASTLSFLLASSCLIAAFLLAYQ